MKNQPLRLTREQVRQVDRIAIDEFGIPGIVLMENAARQLAAHANEIGGAIDRRILIVCGGGNNGGDGYAAARHLLMHAHFVAVLPLVPIEKLTGDARTMADIAIRCGATVIDDIAEITAGAWSVVIDAVFGTGLSRPPEGRMRDAIEAITSLAGRVPVVAVDVPSGLDADTGKPLGACVRADATVTFVAPKTGFDARGAHQYTGRVVVADIGVPQVVIDRANSEPS